jgi:hypothetical protein
VIENKHGPSAAALAFVAGWLLVSGALALAIAPRAIGHDQASLLDSGRRIVGGEVPFRDILDINSPIVHYVNAGPAALAAATGTNPIPWFTGLVLLLSAWSALLADRALLAMAPQARWVERLAVMLVPLGPGTFHLTFADPGQREHLFVLAYFPFFMYRVAAAHGARIGSTTGRFALGVVAAIGVGLKPHFLLPVLAAEAVLLLPLKSLPPNSDLPPKGGSYRRMLLSAEVAGALSTAAACAAAFLLLLPADARAILVEQILPMVLRGYGAYDTSRSVLVIRAGERVLMALVLAGVAWRAGSPALRPVIIPLTAFCLGAVASTLAQGKGFGYHYIPSDAPLLFLAAAAVLALARGRAAPAVRAALAVTIAVSLCVWWPIYAARVSRPDGYTSRVVIEQYTRPGDGVMVLSTSSVFAFPATLQLDRRLVGRQSALLLILALGADAPLERNGPQAGRVIQEMADDIRSARPAAVFIDRRVSCQGCPGGFSVAAFLEADSRIQRALESYRLAGVAQEFDVYLRRR